MSKGFILSIEDAASMMEGSLLINGKKTVTDIVIDSRKAVDGCMFFALKGEIADGHDYVKKSVENGACCCVIDSRKTADILELEKNRACSFIVVRDSLKALQLLAKRYREKFENICIVGITGSSGKTTTKELLGAMLSKKGATVMNDGNFNSETGLPLSVFNIRENHIFGVFELGISHLGEMTPLVDILMPDYAVITNIGTAHIGFMESRENIAKEKIQIFHNGKNFKEGFVFESDDFSGVVINWFENSSNADEKKGKINFFGPENQKKYITGENIGLSGSSISMGNEKVQFPLVGNHNYLNALAAVRVAKVLEVDNNKIMQALEEAKPLFGRGQIIEGAVTTILDCYNSNLESVKSVIDFFDSVPCSGRKILLLGSILELGKNSENIHNSVIEYAVESEADGIFFFGKEIAEYVAKQCSNRGRSGEKYLFWTDESNKMKEALSAYLETGDIVLMKGSRGIMLEQFAETVSIMRKVC